LRRFWNGRPPPWVEDAASGDHETPHHASGFSPVVCLARLLVLTTNQMPAHPYSVTLPPPISSQLHNLIISNGQFGFALTNFAGHTFSVLAATNVALPLSNWTVIGAVTEGPPGRFKFTDTNATASPQRYYYLRRP
jgi:hypothetical protein